MLVAVEGAILASFAYRIVSVTTKTVNPITGGTMPMDLVNIVLASIVFMRAIGTLIL